MKVIVPCAGRSSRFPDMPPKWMLPDHDGVPMVRRAVEGLEVELDCIVIALLAEHEERFRASEGLTRAFGRPVQTVILPEPTRSQSETVYEALRLSGIDEPFLVKDSDNFFKLSNIDVPYNYVSVASLNEFDSINPRNKSYVQVDHEDSIVNFREKQVISDLFSVGGYYFNDPALFKAAYEELSQNPTLTAGELYLSEVISFLAIQGHPFKARRVGGYQDWGTVREWREKLDRRRTYFVSLDGFLFERGSSYFGTKFADAGAHKRAIGAVKELIAKGHSVVFLSIRPEAERAQTMKLLQEAELEGGQLVMNCGVSQWNLVTAPHPTLPFVTGRAHELDPEDPNLRAKLEGAGHMTHYA